MGDGRREKSGVGGKELADENAGEGTEEPAAVDTASESSSISLLAFWHLLDPVLAITSVDAGTSPLMLQRCTVASTSSIASVSSKSCGGVHGSCIASRQKSHVQGFSGGPRSRSTKMRAVLATSCGR
eukprot:CAMPEP_0197654738 /NCGR_PEP_ID=MMETSP1338-20131121/39028_1 /TAXON_ID=43686 ORGANISM="Pelagodinium beii, Strain RCC1491" /NCGR_SAMPLE_ID=MMETSP1338 /ASSEMBLY_ACC=CAM_ASM_000754 /LENGTH=126 /DNA_ID=CAMNT_0043230233 /DNA_START=218 /DNA_END=598 /DNA_ORIENTATION=+